MSFATDPPIQRRVRYSEKWFVATLILGFGLVLVMMVASGVMGLRAMGRIDKEANSMSSRFLRDTRLIDLLIQQQADLSVLIHSLAGEPKAVDAKTLEARFDSAREKTLAVVNEAIQEIEDSTEREAWKYVHGSATTFFVVAQSLARRGLGYSPELSAAYSHFSAATKALLDAAYADAARIRTAQLAVDAGELNSARSLFLLALALAGGCSIISGGVAAVWFHNLKGHAARLEELSLRTLAEHEENARRFSQEMHDEFGQMLNAIESNLTVVKPLNEESAAQLRDAIALSKEAQSTARELSQLLRPQILDDFGLDAGLRELARGFSQRTGIVVDYRSQVRDRLPSTVETHLFRIAQEALTNTARHSVAKYVSISLEKYGADLGLEIQDDGQGFTTETRSHRGLGFLGMKERARAIGGRIDVDSAPGKGVSIRVKAPLVLSGEKSSTNGRT